MIEILGLIAVWFGVGFCIVGVIGIVRLPDLYTRLHASGKVSTLGLAGLAIGAALILPSAALKLIALALFAVLTMPVASHAIAAAAHRHGVPMMRVRRESRPVPVALPLPEADYQDGRSAA